MSRIGERILFISPELTVSLSGDISPPDPDVGHAGGVEDLAVDSINVIYSRGKKVFSKPSHLQTELLNQIAKHPTRMEFLLSRAQVRALCSPIPEWLEEHILDYYSDEITEAFTHE